MYYSTLARVSQINGTASLVHFFRPSIDGLIGPGKTGLRFDIERQFKGFLKSQRCAHPPRLPTSCPVSAASIACWTRPHSGPTPCLTPRSPRGGWHHRPRRRRPRKLGVVLPRGVAVEHPQPDECTRHRGSEQGGQAGGRAALGLAGGWVPPRRRSRRRAATPWWRLPQQPYRPSPRRSGDSAIALMCRNA